jgi:hypothetical protein
MSRQTPRKRGGHRQQPSIGGQRGPRANASDYESDANAYAELAPPSEHLTTRTDADLNLSVLRRYLPTIRSIVSIASISTVYHFQHAAQIWDKTGVEGTLFLCELEPIVLAEGVEIGQDVAFVLNRKGLDNFSVDLRTLAVCETADELLILQMKPDAPFPISGFPADRDADDGQANVIGIWIHNDKTNTQGVNYRLIQQRWQYIHDSWAAVESVIRESQDVVEPATQPQPSISVNDDQPATQQGGRQIDLAQLFSKASS